MKKITFNHNADTLPEVLGFDNHEELMETVMAEGPDGDLSIVVGLASIFFTEEAEKFAGMAGILLSIVNNERYDQPSKAIEAIYVACPTEKQKLNLQKFIIAFHEMYLGKDLNTLRKPESKPTSIKDLQAQFDAARKSQG